MGGVSLAKPQVVKVGARLPAVGYPPGGDGGDGIDPGGG